MLQILKRTGTGVSGMQNSLVLKAGKELINASDDIAQLAVQGPLALKAMQKLTKTPVEDMEYYTFKVSGICRNKRCNIFHNRLYRCRRM